MPTPSGSFSWDQTFHVATLYDRIWSNPPVQIALDAGL